MLALAWICAVLGAIIAYIVSLAGAMSTVPQLHWQDALVAVPLPLVAAALAGWRLLHPILRTPASAPRPWISAALALGLAFFTLLFMAESYFDQPGGPM
jgi:hypothetical protein